MYGSSSSGDGYPVRTHAQPDGATTATVILRDGRTYRVVGQLPRLAAPDVIRRTIESSCKRQVAEEIGRLLDWDDKSALFAR